MSPSSSGQLRALWSAHRWLLAAAALTVALLVAGMIVLGSGESSDPQGPQPTKVKVETLTDTECPDARTELAGVECKLAVFEADGEPGYVKFGAVESDYSSHIGVGSEILVVPAGEEWQLVGLDRSAFLWLLAAALALAWAAARGWRGARELTGVGLAGAVVMGFMIPGLEGTQSETLRSLTGSGLVLVALTLSAHGLRAESLRALLVGVPVLAIGAITAHLLASFAGISSGSESDSALAVGHTIPPLNVSALIVFATTVTLACTLGGVLVRDASDALGVAARGVIVSSLAVVGVFVVGWGAIGGGWGVVAGNEIFVSALAAILLGVTILALCDLAAKKIADRSVRRGARTSEK